MQQWLNLSFELVQDVALVGIIAYLLAHTRGFNHLVIGREFNLVRTIQAILVFGALSIGGTYLGVPIDGAYANTRSIGAVTAGLLGGPVVGIGAGLIGGGHRYLLGGFTALACALGTVFAGAAGGYAHRASRRRVTVGRAAIIALVAELVQRALALLLSRPYAAAVDLELNIGLPMTLVNTAGVAVFIFIVNNFRQERDRIGAVVAQKILEIAGRTLRALRRGLSPESARQVATIIFEISNVAAVAITDTDKILALAGTNDRVPLEALPEGSREVMESQEVKVIHPTRGTSSFSGRFGAGVIAPIVGPERVLGTVQLYRSRNEDVTPADINFATGLAQLVNTQLEFAEMEKQARLRSRAELSMLQAQINPHFLFNALSTIAVFCRINPDKARELLTKLAELFRRTLKCSEGMVSLKDELEGVQAYLAIEQARFGDRLGIRLQVDPEAMDSTVPIFTIQPIVENAMRHGLYPKEGPVNLFVEIARQRNEIRIAVRDNGVGIARERLDSLLKSRPGNSAGGIGLKNVNERLCSLYGRDFGLTIDSQFGEGTVVFMRIPNRIATEREAV